MASATVLLVIHCPTVPVVDERRLPSSSAIPDVCARIERLSGIPPTSQRLSLWSGRTDDADFEPSLVYDLADLGDPCGLSSISLDQCGASDGMGLKVLDVRTSEVRNQFGPEEEARVQKYEMDEKTYAMRQDSVLAYKRKMKIGRFNRATAPVAADAAGSGSKVPEEAKPGARCQVIEGKRRGTICFVGHTKFAPGIWIGVEYDEPVGKNDGSIRGHRYFAARPNHGGFVKPDKVLVGDYSELGIEDDLEGGGNDDVDDDDDDDDDDNGDKSDEM